MTKLKNKLLIILLTIASVFSCVLAGYALNKKTFKANASTETLSLAIVSNNLSYADSIYMIYAVSYNGFDKTQNEIKMLFWEEIQEEYTLGTESYTSSNKGYATVKEQDCLIFYSDGIAAKEMTDDIYARAYVEIDGEVYYSDVMKNSVLEYVHTKREAGGLTEQQTATFDAMLEYGATVQSLLGYNVDRLANETYYRINVENGTLADGFTYGLYKANDIITIQANPAETEKYFSHWEDSTGESVGTEQTQEITVSGANTYTAVYEEEKGLEYTLSDDGTYYSVTGIGTCKDTDIIIPDTYNNLSVTSIGEYAFMYYRSLTSVTIPDSVTSIGSYAFAGCTSLKSIEIPDSVTTIDWRAFYECENLKCVTIPASVSYIGEGVFSKCNNLICIEVAKENQNYNNIDGNLYTKDGTMLIQYIVGKTATEFIIPDSVTIVGNSAFSGCSYLTSIIIPDSSTSTTSINAFAFENCHNLKSIIIPASVTYIGAEAFVGCSNLASVTFKDTAYWNGELSYKDGTHEEISFSSVDLANQETVAIYLTETYYNYTWIKEWTTPF